MTQSGWMIGGGHAFPVAPTPTPFTPSVSGVLTVHINATTGVDASATGAASAPFKSMAGLIARIQAVGGTAAVCAGLTEFYVSCDTALPSTDPVGAIWAIPWPLSLLLVIDLSPSATVAQSGTISSVAQASTHGAQPELFEVLTLSGATAGMRGNFFVNTTRSIGGWIQRDATVACQVAGAKNVEIASPEDGKLLSTYTAATYPNWPGIPTDGTPQAGDSYTIYAPATFTWGYSGALAAGGQVGTGNSLNVVVYGPANFNDAPCFQTTAFGPNVTIAQTMSLGSSATLYGYCVSAYNCATASGADLRGYDSNLIGGWHRTKIALQNAANKIIDGAPTVEGYVTCDSTAQSQIASVSFRTASGPCLQVFGGATVGVGGGNYAGKIGFISALTFRIQTLSGSSCTFGASTFAQVFGSFTGAIYIGNVPYDAGIFAVHASVRDIVSGAVFGSDPAQTANVYGTTRLYGVDTAGQTMGATLTGLTGAACAGYLSQYYTLDLETTTTLNITSVPCTVNVVHFVNGSNPSAPGAPIWPETFGATGNYTRTYSGQIRYADITYNAATTTEPAFQVTAGAGSVVANKTVHKQRVVLDH